MAYQVLDRKVKPGPWGIRRNRHRVAPEWRWAWERSGVVHFPLWGGAGDPYDVVVGKQATKHNTPVWVVSERGAALEFEDAANASDSDAYDLTDPTFDPSEPWAYEVLCVPRDPTNDTNINHWWGFSDTSTSERVAIGADSNTSDQWKILSNGKTPGTGSTVVFGELVHTILAWDGTDFFLYLDGELDYSVTPSSSDWVADLNLVELGRVISSTEAGFNGLVLKASLYPYVPNAAQRRFLARAPFGPFRPTRSIAVRVPSGTAVSSSRLIDYEALASPAGAEGVDYEALRELAATEDVSYESLLAVARTEDVDWEGLVSVSRSGGVDLETLALVTAAAGVSAEWLRALSASRGVSLETLLSVASTEDVDTESLLQLAATETVDMEWTSSTTAVSSSEDVPIEWLGAVSGEGQAPTESLSEVSGDATVPTEWLMEVLASRQVAVETLRAVSRAEDGRLEWLLTVSAAEGVAIEWEQGEFFGSLNIKLTASHPLQIGLSAAEKLDMQVEGSHPLEMDVDASPQE